MSSFTPNPRYKVMDMLKHYFKAGTPELRLSDLLKINHPTVNYLDYNKFMSKTVTRTDLIKMHHAEPDTVVGIWMWVNVISYQIEELWIWPLASEISNYDQWMETNFTSSTGYSNRLSAHKAESFVLVKNEEGLVLFDVPSGLELDNPRYKPGYTGPHVKLKKVKCP